MGLGGQNAAHEGLQAGVCCPGVAIIEGCRQGAVGCRQSKTGWRQGAVGRGLWAGGARDRVQ